MDPFIAKHLDAWLDRQFSGDCHPQLREAMLAVYASDEEHWDRAGWWRVYDAAIDDLDQAAA